jgi:hypothetical protein
MTVNGRNSIQEIGLMAWHSPGEIMEIVNLDSWCSSRGSNLGTYGYGEGILLTHT